MKTERLMIELEYDDKMMHNDEPEAVEWFWLEVMGSGELYLHSNEIGDAVGRVKVLKRLRSPDWRRFLSQLHQYISRPLTR